MMPHFFFNYRERNEYSIDDTGVEFDTFELAYLDAFTAAREMWPEMMSRRVDPRACAFEIADGEGNLLATLNFREVLERCEQGGRLPPRQIEATYARVVDTAYRANQRLAEFDRELGRARGQLAAIKQLVGTIDKLEETAQRP
jgi:hypothetical protein